MRPYNYFLMLKLLNVSIKKLDKVLLTILNIILYFLLCHNNLSIIYSLIKNLFYRSILKLICLKLSKGIYSSAIFEKILAVLYVNLSIKEILLQYINLLLLLYFFTNPRIENKYFNIHYNSFSKKIFKKECILSAKT